MSFFEIVILSFALSMDAFSVSITNGMAMKSVKLKAATIIAFMFGLFQGIMPLIGYALSFNFSTYFETFSRPISFGILFFLGVKMIFETIKQQKNKEDNSDEKHLNLQQLIFLSLATSIDALAVGVTFATIKLQMSVWIACFIIAIITFATCLPGVYLGKKCGEFLEGKGEALGGIILILIAFKIFSV